MTQTAAEAFEAGLRVGEGIGKLKAQVEVWATLRTRLAKASLEGADPAEARILIRLLGDLQASGCIVGDHG